MFVSNNIFKSTVIVFIAGLLFFPVPTNNLWWREAINSGHTALFLFVSIILYYRLKTWFPHVSKVVIYFCVFFIGALLGILIEGLQGLTQREANLGDIYRNLLGIMSGLCLQAALSSYRVHCKKPAVVLFVVAGIGFFLYGVAPLIKLSTHYIERHNAFPVIVDFNENWSMSFMRLDNVELLKKEKLSGQNSGLNVIKFNEGRYSGISIIEPEPDWSNYNALRVTIISNNEYVTELTLRIHDASHNHEHGDRYNRKLIVRPGLNEFEIDLDEIRREPVNRELDLSHVAGLVIFLYNLELPLQIELSNIYLE